MPDPVFEHPRLAAIYDALDPDRSDLVPYLDLLARLKVRRVLDVGCGTGTLAVALAGRGFEVVGVDPAGRSLAVARNRPGGADVRWVHGDATSLPRLQMDAATMTGNVAQAIVEPEQWQATLVGIRNALRPGGRLIFESRVPSAAAWLQWNRAESYATSHLVGVGTVSRWVDTISVEPPLVTFRWTFVFDSDGEVITSDSTLRFRERETISHDLHRAGFTVDEIRDAPDRPGKEFVFLGTRTT